MNFVERPNTSSLCAMNHRVAHLLITRFGVLTAILLKMQVLRDFTPCRLVIIYVSKDLCIHRQGKVAKKRQNVFTNRHDVTFVDGSRSSRNSVVLRLSLSI